MEAELPGGSQEDLRVWLAVDYLIPTDGGLKPRKDAAFLPVDFGGFSRCSRSYAAPDAKVFQGIEKLEEAGLDRYPMSGNVVADLSVPQSTNLIVRRVGSEPSVKKPVILSHAVSPEKKELLAGITN